MNSAEQVFDLVKLGEGLTNHVFEFLPKSSPFFLGKE